MEHQTLPAQRTASNATPGPGRGKPVGRTANASYFADDPRVLIVWPDEGALDTSETANENMDFQTEYFSSVGTPGVVAIYFDRLGGQDRGARQVYAARANSRFALGIALIGGSLLSRALGAFFMGLNKPVAPTRMFATYEDAARWIEQLLGTHS